MSASFPSYNTLQWSHLSSTEQGNFNVRRSRTTFSSRSFSVAAPQAWNQLPADIRQIAT